MIALWIILAAITSAGIAAALTWLIAERRANARLALQQTDLALASERAMEAVRDAERANAELQTFRRDLSGVQQERATFAAQAEAERQNLVSARNEATRMNDELAALRTHLAGVQQDRATLLANVDAEKQNVLEQRRLLEDDRLRLRESFAELSREALQKNSAQFFETAELTFRTLQTEATGSLEQKKAEMQQLLTPIATVLQQYQEKLEKIETARGEAYTGISDKLAAVAATQQHLSHETTQLVGALRRPTARGRWGELTLKRLFEMAGMAERVTFTEQVNVNTEDGKLIPDCVIELPENRQVIVDSKCVLDAFLDATACVDETGRQACMAKHALHVRARVRALANKAYWESFGKAADYVILFLPGEAFLYAAVENDVTLIEDALKQRVIVASPTTLLGLLRVIEHGWRSAQVQENADAIREAAVVLLDRLAVLTEHFQKLGSALGGASDAYNKTLASLERNVFTQAKRMRDLGAAGTKSPKKLIAVDESVRPMNKVSWAALPQTSFTPADEPSVESATEEIAL